MAELTNVLRLTFGCSDGSTVTLSVPDCKTNLTPQVVKEAMNALIVENVFSFDGGDLATAVSAKIVKTEYTEVF